MRQSTAVNFLTSDILVNKISSALIEDGKWLMISEADYRLFWAYKQTTDDENMVKGSMMTTYAADSDSKWENNDPLGVKVLH